MKKFLTLSAALLVVAAGAAHGQTGKPAQKPAAPAAQPAPAAPPAAAPSGKPESLQDRASYTIGLNLGKSLKTNEIQANIDLIVKGLRDGLGGGQALLTDEEMQAAMQTLQQQVGAQQEAKRKAAGEKNKAEGEAYLAKNKEKAGVKTTASGLQYEVITEGTGPMPKATDSVTVNYKGTLMDGTVFDSSYDRKEPVTFVLNQVIPGWTEGVQLMKVGSKYKFYIPSALGYGERGAGATIGPNSPLIFEVELISIGAPAAAPGAGAEAKPEAATTPKPAATAKPPAPKPADKKPPV
ncbi:MAG TPA: FKBP-type peptidyl-prolyl cis-trans isomerase [Thermoanaerobaculia bacterium]|jgi:FKBP-type peptidyl-prolyl cis-trans isomerase|nr:FKBP-type peptidyl-prolyl cis-trans isomerase [Thermoanaerobaculia bacterium]